MKLYEQLHIDIYIKEELTDIEKEILDNIINDKELRLIIQAAISPTPNAAKKIQIELTK